MQAAHPGKGDPCKGCSASVHVADAQIERVLAKLSLHADDCVGDDRYAARLAECGTCPSLQYGTTCAHCGCFVRVRAKLAAKSCPQPGGSRWA
ncbi:DUF6171 family protein [Paenibacillus glycinis]|uniref:Uncharacterized protein n=1 Tax=Paenibacillus glycinis TaxID=2697035 RepID=A0ABW9XPL2_9BACL|nr:DUF6171 family protein [Paenibacillus glycinis]NBD24453.1 hypothetical protein [Paenibacillus glycinis]